MHFLGHLLPHVWPLQNLNRFPALLSAAVKGDVEAVRSSCFMNLKVEVFWRSDSAVWSNSFVFWLKALILTHHLSRVSQVSGCCSAGVSLLVRDSTGCTALHLAAQHGHTETVSFILEHGEWETRTRPCLSKSSKFACHMLSWDRRTLFVRELQSNV